MAPTTHCSLRIARQQNHAGGVGTRALPNFNRLAGTLALPPSSLEGGTQGGWENVLQATTDSQFSFDYYYDMGWNRLIDEDGSAGIVTRTYTIAQPGAAVSPVLGFADGSSPSTGTWRFLTHDHPEAERSGVVARQARRSRDERVGSTRNLWDSTKSAVGDYAYAPYGEPIRNAGAPVSGIGPAFTGKPYDADTGLYHFPYRHYDPALARWLTRDPLGMVDGPNLYAYVRGNPVRMSDPLGLSFWCLVLGQAVSAGIAALGSALTGIPVGAAVVGGAIGSFVSCLCNLDWDMSKAECCIPAVIGGALGGLFSLLGLGAQTALERVVADVAGASVGEALGELFSFYNGQENLECCQEMLD